MGRTVEEVEVALALPLPLGVETSGLVMQKRLYASRISDSSEAEMLFSFASLDWRALGSEGAEAALRFGGW